MLFQMPGDSFQGNPQPLTAEERAVREQLQAHVRTLSDEIGERHYWLPERLHETADYIAAQLAAQGHEVIHHPVPTRDEVFHSIEVQLPGRGLCDEVLVVGAHYDTVRGSPGADDNASGVAVLLELARLLKDTDLDCGVRLVAFVNEEDPFFGTDAMGSLRYARQARERGDQIIGMISLEMLGYFCHEPGCQEYPPLLGSFFPDRGDFVAFVGNMRSRSLVRQAIGTFREHAAVPSEGLAAPELLGDISRSDHWAFWQLDYPAMMLTDTANFRNPHYHGAKDTRDRLDYDTMARLVVPLARTVEQLAQR